MERTVKHPGSCPSKPLPLGRLVITQGVNTKLMENIRSLSNDEMVQFAAVQMFIKRYLSRHSTGDWGDLDEHDTQANAMALEEGTRVMSVYNDVEYIEGHPTKDRIYIITEYDRSATTILFPSEY